MNNKQPPFGPLGYITYKRTYARKLSEHSEETEEFEDTINRIISSSNKQLKVGFTQEEQLKLKDILMSLKGSVAGRFLWQLGTKTVDTLGLPSLQNCATVAVDEPIRPFTWAFDMLMLGSGVGFNLQREYVYKLPKVVKKKFKIERKDSKDADFIVPDSREGWVKLLGKVLKSYFYSGEGFSYSTICIRGKGTPIKGFGGIASGPEDLVIGIQNICKVLDNRRGKQLRSIDCLDIVNIIAAVVVSGNVRRSAEICIGDFDDLEFLNAKNWSLGNIPNWRAMSNNTIVCNDITKLPHQFWDGYLGNGEPYGLLNLNLCKKIGRTGETEYPDEDVIGTNPCQPGFATILTRDGIKTFDDINIGDYIWSQEGWTKVLNKWSTGVKPVYKYKTSFGVFVGTDNHRLVTRDGKIEAKYCDEVHVLKGPFPQKIEKFIPEQVMAGLFLGDGYHKKMKNREYTYPVLCIGENDKDYFESEISHLILNQFDSKEYNVNTNMVKDGKSWNLTINEYCKNLSQIELLSFLRGLYTANGSVIKQSKSSVRITYKTTSKMLAEELQVILSSIGIRSYITTNKPKVVKFSNGEYECKESYDINITKDFREFYSRIGFLQKYKMQKIQEVIETYKQSQPENYSSIKEIEYLGDYEVYDITVDNNSHTYWTGGLNVSNCSEQPLNNFESCCLAEIFLPNNKTYEDLLETAIYLYRINKHSLALSCHHKETQEVVNGNMRMGIGVTGYLQATEEQRNWLDKLYKDLRQYDKEYSLKNGFPESIKLTTVKPSGSLSLLAGVTPGGHPGFSQYFIRRIRIASNSPLVELCRENGYEIEYQKNFDGTEDRSTVVVSFPCSFPEGTKLAKDMTAIDQLEVVARLQKEWSDNAVSVTVYYKLEELEDIKKWLNTNYNEKIKAVSFLLHSEHGFKQAPYEEITKERYEEMVAKCKPITGVSFSENDVSGVDECASGYCPIK